MIEIEDSVSLDMWFELSGLSIIEPDVDVYLPITQQLYAQMLGWA